MQATVPSPATAAQLAASITFLLSDDGTNVNGAILASDGGACSSLKPVRCCMVAEMRVVDQLLTENSVRPYG